MNDDIKALGKITKKNVEEYIYKIKKASGFKSNGWSITPSGTMYLSYRNYITSINKFNYHIGTEVDFIFKKVDFDDMILNSGLEYFKSDSGSEYLFDDNKVYRRSDHWGKVASCFWDIKNIDFKEEDFKSDSFGRITGVAYFKEFKLSGLSGGYFTVNPVAYENFLKNIENFSQKVNLLIQENKSQMTEYAIKLMRAEIDILLDPGSYIQIQFKEAKSRYQENEKNGINKEIKEYLSKNER